MLTGDPTLVIVDRPVARIGDLVSCPRCKRKSRIVSGAATLHDGQRVALHDDTTDCGARLLASQWDVTYGDESHDHARANLHGMPAFDSTEEAQPTASWLAAEDPFVLRFRAVNPATQVPLRRRPYVVTRRDGTQHGGLTDSEGYTADIEAIGPEPVAVHFSFADAAGRSFDREELVP